MEQIQKNYSFLKKNKTVLTTPVLINFFKVKIRFKKCLEELKQIVPQRKKLKNLKKLDKKLRKKLLKY